MTTERQRRIEELKPRVAARRVEQARRLWEQARTRQQEDGRVFLADLSSLQLLDFVPIAEVVGAPDVLANYVFRHEELPVARIAAYDLEFSALKPPAAPDKLCSWITECFKQFIPAEEYLIAFGESFGFIDWAKVRVMDQDMWLWDLWQQTSYKNIMVLSTDQTSVFFVYKAEYLYEGYLHQFDLQAHPIVGIKP